LIRGLVQGVGFRPFIYRLACKHGLFGEVDNRTNGVSVVVQGDLRAIDKFSNDILKHAPPASQIKSIEVNQRILGGFESFRIVESKVVDNQITEISPDIAVCHDCLNDIMTDPERINYSFTNCTNCGPRFTIIERLPYDRANTSMKSFKMCEKCSSEYSDILDRRFHAQPVACNSCGPAYIYKDPGKSLFHMEEILKEMASQIIAGRTVALKGMGGYHLMCDPFNNQAVNELRSKKQRDGKPFAVMFRDISSVKEYCIVEEAEEHELISWRRPVLILRQKKHLAEAVSNGLNTTGVLLPYLPVHYQLFKILEIPAVVLTSANVADEPIIIDDDSAEKKLSGVAGSIVSHNREIINRNDDSVIRIINNRITMIRRSRGFVPRPVDLNFNVNGILALGAEQKNSFCLGIHYQAILSQYIGDLKNLPVFNFFRESIARFYELFRFNPEYIACDLHPDYLSTQYAAVLEKELKVPVIRIQHHHAHIASAMAENGLDEKVIGVCFDGTGYGTDDKIWGGEFLIADHEKFTRFIHFDYVPMPGGDRTVAEPWRMAFSYLYKYFRTSFDPQNHRIFRSIDKEAITMVREMIDKNINSPLTSSAGRLFDAVSAILGLCGKSEFDSEAPMRLESAINCETDLYYPFKIEKTIEFAGMFREIIKDSENIDVSVISAKFHNTLAQVILEVSEMIRDETALNKVVLSGGVFQNKYLLERSYFLLTRNKFRIFTNHLVPSNDGGVSLGQLMIASKKIGLCV
jgi:hydrogenase maturation protein HypF